MSRRLLIALSALLGVIAVLFFVWFFHRCGSHHLVWNPSTAPASEPADLNVGVYLSKVTGDRVGYSCQMTQELLHRHLNVRPILDVGPEAQAGAAKVLGVYFAGKTAIYSNDVEGLKALDVIVAPRIWFLSDEARTSIEAAVTNGTGLLIRDGLGCMGPGSGPEVSRLNGFVDSGFGYNAHPMDCQVIADHPILGKLTMQTGETVSITPNGTWGTLGEHTVPLIKVKDMDAFREFFSRGDDTTSTFYPLYVSQLGKGRIVGCQFPAWSAMPTALASATDSEFNLRCVLWLAHRLDEPNAASTQP
jgi:hypothetical protein